MNSEKRCSYDGFDKKTCFYRYTMATKTANNGKCGYDKVCKYQVESGESGEAGSSSQGILDCCMSGLANL